MFSLIYISLYNRHQQLVNIIVSITENDLKKLPLKSE